VVALLEVALVVTVIIQVVAVVDKVHMLQQMVVGQVAQVLHLTVEVLVAEVAEAVLDS
jgi:hypothetical protein